MMTGNINPTYVEQFGPFLKVWGILDQNTVLHIEKTLLDISSNSSQGHVLVPPTNAIQYGLLCCLQMQDTHYYRVQVVNTALLPKNIVEVFFLDYGHKSVVSVAALRIISHLAPTIVNIPPQAREFILANVTHNGASWKSDTLKVINDELLRHESQFVVVNQIGTCTLIKLFNNGEDALLPLFNRGVVLSIATSAQNMILQNAPTATKVSVVQPFANTSVMDLSSPTLSEGSSVTSTILSYKAMTLEPNTEYYVYISYVSDGPAQFYVQLQSYESSLARLMNDINAMTLHPLDEDIIPGTLCVAKCLEDDHICRAVVTSIVDGNYKVFYVDFGNIETVNIDNLFQIPSKYVIPRVMAIRFSLANLERSGLTVEMKCAFKEFVNDKLLKMHTVPSQTRAPMQLCLLWDDKNVNILDVLKKSALLAYPPITQLTRGFNQEVHISYVASCSRFYIQVKSKDEHLRYLMSDLQLKCPQARIPDQIKLGLPCCALFEADQQWYRAQISSIDGDLIMVKYVDYGNEESVLLSNLRAVMDEQITGLKPQAIECCLNGYQNMSEDAERDGIFEELILEKDYTMRVIEIQGNKTLVELIDASRYNVGSLLLEKLASSKSQVSPVLIQDNHNIEMRKRESSAADRNYNNYQRGGSREKTERQESWRQSKSPRKDSFNDDVTSNGFDKGDNNNANRNFEENRRGINRDKPKRNDMRRDDWKTGNDFNRETSREDRRKGDNDFSRNETRRDDRNKGDHFSRNNDTRKDDWGQSDDFDGQRNKSSASRDNKEKSWSGSPNKKNWSESNDKKSWGDNSEKKSWGDNSEKKSWSDNSEKKTWGDNSEKKSWGDNTEKKSWGDNTEKKSWGDNTEKKSWGDNSEKKTWGDNSEKKSWGDNSEKKSWGDNSEKKSWGESSDKNWRNNSRDRSTNDGKKPFKKNDSFSPPPKASSYTVANPASYTSSYGLPKVEGLTKKVIISWFHDPQHFFCQLEEFQDEFVKMMNEIQSVYPDAKPVKAPVGAPVIALFPEDKILYRARILSLQGFQYKVQYIDFGNVSHTEKVYPIEQKYMELPAQAICCSLNGILPIQTEWPESDKFSTYFGQDFFMCNFLSSMDGSYFVDLTIDDKYLSETLVENNLAKYYETQEALDTAILYHQQLRIMLLEVKDLENINVQLETGILLPCTIHNLSQATTKHVDVLKDLVGQLLIIFVDNVLDTKLEVTFYDSYGVSLKLTEPHEDKFIDTICPLPVYSSTVRGWVSYFEKQDKKFRIFVQFDDYANILVNFLDCVYNQYNGSTLEQILIPEIGSVYAVLSCDTNWYRAHVTNIEDTAATVYFIDYGNTEIVEFANFRELDQELKIQHILALPTSSESYDESLTEFKVTTEFGLELTILNYDPTKPAEADTAEAPPAPAIDTVQPVGVPVIVSHVDTPNEFYLQLAEATNTIDALLNEIQENVSTWPILENPVAGILCAAPYSIDQLWYRAQVLDADADITTVRFVDYGNTDVIDNATTQIKTLPSEMLAFEQHARRCSLQIKSKDVEWSPTVCERFEALTHTEDLLAEIVHQDDKTTYVELIAKQENIAQTLINENVATQLLLETSTSNTGYVSNLNSPSEFWIQLENSVADLESIADRLVNADKFPELEDLTPGSLCAALFPDDEMWYRARILSNTVAGLEVLFIDYGNSCTCSGLRQLPEDLIMLPALAQKCSLQKPTGILQWSEQAVAEFKTIAAEGATVFNIEKLSTGETSVVKLLLYNEDISLRLLPTTYDAYIGHCESLSCFYIQKVEDSSKGEEISEKLTEASNWPKCEQPVVGNDILVALFPDDELYYRARIVSTDESGYEVFFVDYGNMAKTTDIRLPADGIEVEAPLARQSRLEPLPGYRWTEESLKKFIEILNEGSTLFQIEDVCEDVVQVYLDGSDVRLQLDYAFASAQNTPKKSVKVALPASITEAEEDAIAVIETCLDGISMETESQEEAASQHEPLGSQEETTNESELTLTSQEELLTPQPEVVSSSEIEVPSHEGVDDSKGEYMYQEEQLSTSQDEQIDTSQDVLVESQDETTKTSVHELELESTSQEEQLSTSRDEKLKASQDELVESQDEATKSFNEPELELTSQEELSTPQTEVVSTSEIAEARQEGLDDSKDESVSQVEQLSTFRDEQSHASQDEATKSFNEPELELTSQEELPTPQTEVVSTSEIEETHQEGLDDSKDETVSQVEQLSTSRDEQTHASQDEVISSSQLEEPLEQDLSCDSQELEESAQTCLEDLELSASQDEVITSSRVEESLEKDTSCDSQEMKAIIDACLEDCKSDSSSGSYNLNDTTKVVSDVTDESIINSNSIPIENDPIIEKDAVSTTQEMESPIQSSIHGSEITSANQEVISTPTECESNEVVSSNLTTDADAKTGSDCETEPIGDAVPVANVDETSGTAIINEASGDAAKVDEASTGLLKVETTDDAISVSNTSNNSDTRDSIQDLDITTSSNEASQIEESTDKILEQLPEIDSSTNKLDIDKKGLPLDKNNRGILYSDKIVPGSISRGDLGDDIDDNSSSNPSSPTSKT